MPWLKFMIPVAISSLIFSFFYISVGYIAGSAWLTIEAWSGRLAVFVAGVIIIIIFLWWLKSFLVHQGKQLKALLANTFKTFFAWYPKTIWWNKFTNKFPLLSKKIIKLTNPANFFGLPFFSLLLTNIILIVLTFYLAIISKIPTSFIVGLDYRLQEFVHLFSNVYLAKVMFFITMLGSPYFILIVSAVFSFWLFWEKRQSYIMGLWIAVSGAFLSSSLIKIIIARPRPIPTFLFESSYSFPSFHAMIAVVLFMFITYYAIRAYPRWSRNISLVLIAVLFVLVIGFSRTYLGVHYFSDVIGGYMLGAFWFIVAVISQHSLQPIDKPRRSSKMLQIIILSGMVIFVAGIYCLQIFQNQGISADFFAALSKINSKQQILFVAGNLSNDLLVTENLGSGLRRPINFIFNTKATDLSELLVKAGWTKRLEPTLSNVLMRGTSTLFKRPYPDAPLRPRFWNNEPNNFTFTKTTPANKQVDFYILRLWQVDQQKFIAELAVNKDFAWHATPQEDILNLAISNLLNDFKSSNKIFSLESKTINVNLGDETKDKVNATIYTVNLK